MTVQRLETSEKQIGEESYSTGVSTAIKSLKAGKAPGEGDILPEILKTMNNFGVCWLTRIFQVAWKTGQIPKQLQISVLIPIQQKRRQEEVH